MPAKCGCGNDAVDTFELRTRVSPYHAMTRLSLRISVCLACLSIAEEIQAILVTQEAYRIGVEDDLMGGTR